MRKTVALSLLITIALGVVSPLAAQKSAAVVAKQNFVKDAQFDIVRAMTDGSGVLVRWQMRSEASIAGYNVFRVNGGVRTKINPSIIPGSSARYADRIAYGEFYQFFDVTPDADARYLIEGQRMDGSRFYTREIAVEQIKSMEAEAGMPSETLRNAAGSSNSDVESRSSSMSSELSDLVSSYSQTPDPVNQHVIASKPGAKIAVKSDGFYRVTAAELQAANFPLTSDSSKWRLFTNGVEQAMIVGPDRAYIEFYGRGVDRAETDTRIYYLIADTVPGKRIGTKVVRSVPGGAVAKNFPVMMEKKERSEAVFQLFNGDEENFLGRFFESAPTSIRFNLSGIDFSQLTATIKVSLYGFSDNHHRIDAKINGHDLPTITQFGKVFYWGTTTIPTDQLIEGENLLEIGSQTAGDYNYFDRVEVDYKRTYSAENGKLSFSTPGFRKINLSGFATPAVRILDTTFEGNPVLLTKIPVEESSEGYVVRVPSTRAMVGYAFDDTALLQSPAVTQNLPSTLSAASNRANMVIISHSDPSFLAGAETWAAYRRSASGGALEVKVADITDVYDEYSYGMVTSDAIKGLLENASNTWAVHPGYVLLMGDATYDPRNYEGYGNFNFVPSRSASLILEESWSDEALGDFDGDNVSNLAIGRIPARIAAQITTALNKTIAYEANQSSFSRGALFTHDAPIGYNFEAMSQQLAQRLPQGTPISMVSASEPNASANLVTQLNQGKSIVNYSGHGSSGLWANTNYFTIFTAGQLTNRDNPSIVTMLSCLGGYFLPTNRQSMSEALLFNETGGAAAAWASTSETTPDVQLVMGDKFFRELAGTDVSRIGDAIRISKKAIPGGTDVQLSWVLIGDPALKMP